MPFLTKFTFLITIAFVYHSLLFGQNDISLKNSQLQIKLDLTRGGAIYYISKTNTNRNIINIADEGRYVQQSYYAGRTLDRKAEGQSPDWSPWSWNPIQVGDAFRNRAKILKYRKTGNTIYVKCTPMLWDMNNKPAEAEMEQWTTLSGNVIKVKNKLTCHRTDTIYGEARMNDQELPAVYPISALKNLYTYFGNQPFTSAPLTNPESVLLSSGFWGRYNNDIVTENWMAYVDEAKWGIGVYSPMCSNFLAGMHIGPDGEANSDATSYIAPLKKYALDRNSILEYDYYLIIGNLSEIRETVYKIRRTINKKQTH